MNNPASITFVGSISVTEIHSSASGWPEFRVQIHESSRSIARRVSRSRPWRLMARINDCAAGLPAEKHSPSGISWNRTLTHDAGAPVTSQYKLVISSAILAFADAVSSPFGL